MTNASKSDPTQYSTAKTPPTSPTLSLCDCEVRSQLEEEAMAAVREFSFAVQSVCISEMLPRTSELLFLNLTTLEQTTYCIELTAKGWRIASNRADCMNGDFRQLHVHTQYFESLYQLLDSISPMYRDRFGGQLINRLNDLEKEN
ncbi:unnamed protein product [Heligmosomoides polygyrus]|uniref:DUF727 domain-containing protein n=2 Tax=Heligmosomoides polygyrus TaxID=6339 RepID=A0A183GWY4_HELPZ|nr:unnamed protein product [Heligmosomoides polygyrus]